MNNNLMRSIDKNLGIPICFLLTLIDKIRKLFIKPLEVKAPKKILFIKPSEIGGIILSHPLLSQLRIKYPDARIFFLTFEKNRSLLNDLGIFGKIDVLTIRDNYFPEFLVDLVKVLIQLRREKIDATFDLEFLARFTAMVAYLSGASKRTGFHRFTMEGLYRGDLFTHKIIYNPHAHVSQMYLAMVDSFDSTVKSAPEIHMDLRETPVLPVFSPTRDQKERMRKRLQLLNVEDNSKLFLINPGEGQIPLREWPIENFIALCRRLLKGNNHYVLMVGNKDSSSKASLICESLKNIRCLNLSGETSLIDLLTLFSMSAALIANDCGIAHLASLTAIKQFIFFGPETPKVFSPLSKDLHIFYDRLICSPCLSAFNHRTSFCQNNICLQKIGPDEVINKLFTILNQN